MHFNTALIPLCGGLLMSGVFTSAFAAAIAKRSFEIQFLTGAALSEALSTAKMGLPGNLTLPTRRSDKVDKRVSVCDSDYICELAYLTTEIENAGGEIAPTIQRMLDVVGSNTAYASEMSSEIATSAASNIDLPGDVAQSFYLGFAANSYALVSSLITNGAVQAYLQIASSGIWLNSYISLEDVNVILSYCDDTTYDALASRIASLVDAFLTQFTNANDDDTSSPTVLATNVDTATGLVDGISVGATFELAGEETALTQSCPAYGYYW